MSEVANTIDAVIAARLASELKRLGFRKQRRNLRRLKWDAVQVINVQASMYNAATDGRFTVNLGLYYPAIATYVAPRVTTDNPTEPDCALRRRIGALLPEPNGGDWWWPVSIETDLDALGWQVAEAVLSYGLPWLDRLAQIHNAAAAPEGASTPMVCAALLLAIGKRDEAVALMTARLGESTVAASAWLSFARTAGLELEFKEIRHQTRQRP